MIRKRRPSDTPQAEGSWRVFAFPAYLEGFFLVNDVEPGTLRYLIFQKRREAMSRRRQKDRNLIHRTS